jgi:hypothetical protein
LTRMTMTPRSLVVAVAVVVVVDATFQHSHSIAYATAPRRRHCEVKPQLCCLPPQLPAS